jgi:hypothetical protein
VTIWHETSTNLLNELSKHWCHMNPERILALISNLADQIAALEAANEALRKQLELPPQKPASA